MQVYSSIASDRGAVADVDTNLGRHITYAVCALAAV